MLTTIRTSQRSFVIDPDRWLGKSRYFENLFSGKWGDKQDDGSYYIVTDATIFDHVLRYLRTGILPVFFDKDAGHDYALYQALLEEAAYFAIDRLERWLRERKYLDTIKIIHRGTENQVKNSWDEKLHSASSNMQVTMTPIIRRTSEFYCPSGMHNNGSARVCEYCITEARKAGNSSIGGWRDEDRLIWCVVQREVIFDHDLCVTFLADDEPEPQAAGTI